MSDFSLGVTTHKLGCKGLSDSVYINVETGQCFDCSNVVRKPNADMLPRNDTKIAPEPTFAEKYFAAQNNFSDFENRLEDKIREILGFFPSRIGADECDGSLELYGCEGRIVSVEQQDQIHALGFLRFWTHVGEKTRRTGERYYYFKTSSGIGGAKNFYGELTWAGLMSPTQYQIAALKNRWRHRWWRLKRNLDKTMRKTVDHVISMKTVKSWIWPE